MYYELSSSTGQKSRSEVDVMYYHTNAIIQARISVERQTSLKLVAAECNA